MGVVTTSHCIDASQFPEMEDIAGNNFLHGDQTNKHQSPSHPV